MCAVVAIVVVAAVAGVVGFVVVLVMQSLGLGQWYSLGLNLSD